MTEQQSITYFPKDGVIYSGAAEDINSLDMGAQYLASIQRKSKDNSYSASSVSYEFTDVSEHFANVKRMIEKKAYLDKINKHRGFSASINQEMAYIEKSAELNDSAISQITIVQFIQSILGQIENVNVITKAFKNLPLNSLRGKIPEGGTPDITLQVDRLSEPKITHTDFGQTEFRIKRNDIHIYISREDRMEASMDPLAFSTAQGQRQMLQARDLMALKEASNLKKQSYGTISDPTTTTGTVSARATNDVIDDFLELYNEHFTKYRNAIKYIILNNRDYRAIQTNFYLRNNVKVAPAKGFGVTPFIGLEEYGITAIISPWVPRLTGYAFTSEGAYELDGPKIIDTEYDAKKFADYTPMRDFIGYKIVNPARYGEKFTIAINGVTAEKEITTDSQIEALLTTPPVDKNDDA